MRLEKLYLDGFGRFHKYAIDDISDGVTVFYGPNEAGKSTLLAFIRGVLFEFPHRITTHYPPLSGGKYGGRITVSDSDGESHTIERFRRRLKVTGPSGRAQEDPKAALARLTGNITQSHFKNIFAFSLEELQSGDTLDDSYIHSVGQGVPRLPKLLKSLEDRKRKIFHSRGRKKTRVTGILKELREVDGRLEDIKKNAQDYGEKSARHNEVDQELEAANDKLARTREELGRIDMLRQGWDDWVDMENIKTRLVDIPQFDKFPEDPIPRLEGFEKQLRQAEEERDGVKEEYRQADEEASMLVHDEALLEDSDRIEEIRRERGRFDGSIHDLPERQGELKDLESRLSDRLGALGPGWNESNLRDIDTSVTAHGQVSRLDGQLAGAEEADRGAKTRLDGAKTKVDDLVAKKQDIDNQMSNDSEGQVCAYLEKLLDDRDSLDNIRRWAGSFDSSVQDLPKRQGELDMLRSQLEHKMSNLGRGWDTDRLDTFDTSIELRHEVDRFNRQLADTGEKARLAENLLEREQSQLDEREKALRKAQKQMPEDDAPTTEDEIDLQRQALLTSRSRFNEYERERINHQNLNDQLDALAGGRGAEASAKSSSRLRPISALAIGGALAGAGAYTGEPILGAVGGAALLGTVIYLLATRRKGQKGPGPVSAVLSRQAAEAKSRAESARLALVKAAGPLDIDDPTDSALDTAEERIYVSEKALSAWKEAHRHVTDAQRALMNQELKTGEASQKAKADAESESKVQGLWRDWLGRHGLSDTFMPNTVIELIGSINDARSVLDQIRDKERRIGGINRDIGEYLALVRQMADRYSLSLDEKDHQRVKSVADKLIREFDRADKLVGMRDDAERQMQQNGPAYDKAAAEEKEAAENLASVQSRWNDWLRKHNIGDDFTPKMMQQFMARADTAVTALEEVRRMRTRIAAIEKDIGEFGDMVKPLASAHNIPLNRGESEQVADAADLLIEKLEKAQGDSARQKAAILKRDGEWQRLEQCEKRLQSAREELRALLREGGAEGSEDFRRRAAQHGERAKLEQQRDEHDRALARLSGPGEKKETFLESLNNSDLSELDARHGKLKDRIDRLEATRSELHVERGRISNALEQLAGEEESSVLRRRRNVLREQLLENAKEWSRLVLEKTLLERTQQKFERERQPAVITHAKEFFYNVTDKRYPNLYAPIGERKINVEDTDGKIKEPHQLSRGTREQLYLALRFGLIQDLGERAELLPVVIDEALVNFDPHRARLTAQSLDLLAKTNQVLVFTCHPGMRDLFVEVANAKVVEIKGD